MYQLIFIILLILVIYKFNKKPNSNSSALSSPYSILKKALVNQQFSNIKTITSSGTLNLITADSHGENYLFGIKSNNMQFSMTELDYIYDKAQKSHIHNVVIITPKNISSPEIKEKIADYNFEVWTLFKLLSLSKSNSNESDTYTKSVLRTSNTYYDKNEIDNTPVNPIQHGPSKSHSLLGNLFNRPNRL